MNGRVVSAALMIFVLLLAEQTVYNTKHATDVPVELLEEARQCQTECDPDPPT